MIYTIRLLLLVLISSSLTEVFAQALENAASTVELTYVEEVNTSSLLAQGSLVVKNNYLERSLKGHLLTWELSKNGNPVASGDYALEGVNAGNTKYIDLDKLFDREMIQGLRPSLITLYAEVQDISPDATLKRIVGESVVLAEAEIQQTRKGLKPQRYQVIKVGGAKIHRIANGNTLSIDAYHQLSALDLGKGNVLAGPLLPTLSYSSLSAKQEVAQRIESLGPTSVTIEKDELSGIIAYDLGSYGLLNLQFDLSDQGLSVELQLENAVNPPTNMGVMVPIRSIPDSIEYVGQQVQTIEHPRYGDRRIGNFILSTKEVEASSNLIDEVRNIALGRADIEGASFNFQLQAIETKQDEKNPSKRHSMTEHTKFLIIERPIGQVYGSRQQKPLSAGKWLFTPASK